MKIILKHTLSSIKQNVGQILIMIITMIIITACVFVALSVTDIFRKNAEVWSKNTNADSDLRISGDIDQTKLNIILEENKEYIKDYSYASELSFTIKSNYDTTKINLIITDANKMLDILETPIISEVENTTEYPSIIVSRILSEKLSINVGDVIEVSRIFFTGEVNIKMFVSKIVENSTYFYHIGELRAMVDRTDVTSLFENGEVEPSTCRVYLHSPDELYPNDPSSRTIIEYLQDEINASLNVNGANKVSFGFYTTGHLAAEKSLTETQNTLDIAIAVIVLMMVFILYFSYSIIAKNRSEIIIRFKAAGATPLQTIGIMLIEVVFYAIIACTIGVIFGKVINDTFASSMLYSKSTLLTYEPWQYLVSLFAGIFTGIISCLVPAYKISRKSIRQLMTGDMLISKRAPLIVPLIFTVLLTGCFVALFSYPDYALYSMIALVIVGCFWVVTITPYILELLSIIIGKIILRKEGKLATLGLHRNSGIATVTAMMSLMICFIWAGISIIGVISTVNKEDTSQYTSDYIVEYRGTTLTSGYQTEIDNLLLLDGLHDGVSYKSLFGRVTYESVDNQSTYSEVRFSASSSAEGIKYLTKEYDESVIDAFDNTTRPIIVPYGIAQKLDIEVGSLLNVSIWYDSQGYTLDEYFTVVGIDHYYTNFDAYCIIKMEDLVSNGIQFSKYGMLLAFNGDDDKFLSLRETIDSNDRTLYRTSSYYISTEGNEDLFAIMDYVSYFFYFVSAIGLINLITITAIERKKEMEIFRLVGLTTGGAFRMTIVEGIIISISGFIMGLILAIAISQLQPIFCSLLGKYAIFETFSKQMFKIATFSSIIGLLMWMASPLFATTIISHKNKKTIHSAD